MWDTDGWGPHQSHPGLERSWHSHQSGTRSQPKTVPLKYKPEHRLFRNTWHRQEAGRLILGTSIILPTGPQLALSGPGRPGAQTLGTQWQLCWDLGFSNTNFWKVCEHRGHKCQIPSLQTDGTWAEFSSFQTSQNLLLPMCNPKWIRTFRHRLCVAADGVKKGLNQILCGSWNKDPKPYTNFMEFSGQDFESEPVSSTAVVSTLSHWCLDPTPRNSNLVGLGGVQTWVLL